MMDIKTVDEREGSDVFMEFEGVKEFPILQLGLSQIYLNEKKINAIEQWFKSDDMSIFEAVPVHDFGNGKYTLTDGHSRAYVAYKYGLSRIPIVYDNDEIVAGKLGQKLYRADIEWCERFHITDISNLEDCILSNEDYQKFWIERCDRSYNLLTQIDDEKCEALKRIVPELFLYGASNDLQEIYFENVSKELFVYRNGLITKE